MGLFKVENGLLVIDKDEVRGIPEFKVILERDKGSKGDADGRKKLQAFKEFYYIYWMADFESWINKGGYNEREKHKLSIKEALLDEDWKIYPEIKPAIEKYSKTQLEMLPALGTLSTIITGLKAVDKVSKNIIDNIDATIEFHNEARKRAAENGEPLKIGDDLVIATNLVAQLKQLLDISNKVPTTIKVLQDIEERLAKEKSGINLGRGGKKIGNRAG
jgi:hypothetical protein